MSGGARVGVVVVGVGRVAEVLLETAELVLGPLEDVAALCFDPPLDPDHLRREVAAAVDRAEQGRGVLLVADLCGSSVSNACYDVARGRARVDVLCGANLAMLTKLYAADRAVLEPTSLARLLADTGRRGIVLASDAFATLEEPDDDA